MRAWIVHAPKYECAILPLVPATYLDRCRRRFGSDRSGRPWIGKIRTNRDPTAGSPGHRLEIKGGINQTMPTVRATERASGALLGLAIVTLAAWGATASLASSMHGMSGTMGLGVAAFVAAWTLMMAAMMLPSVAPVALSYQRVIKTTRGIRLSLFVGGYLSVWSGAGIVAFAIGLIVDRAIRTGAGPLLAATVFVLAALYQLSPLKEQCLRHCRSPVSLLMRYSSYEARLRDAAVGAHHGAYCLGCCWALFAVLVVVGSMSLTVMVMLAGVVLLEKRWRHGVALSHVVALACLAAAVLVVMEPSLVPGLATSEPQPMEM